MTKRVKDAMQRQKSRGRLIVPAVLAFLRFFMFVLVVGSSAFGIWRLWQTAINDPRFRTDGEMLVLAGAIRECPESVAELEAIGRKFNGRSLFDPLLLTDIRQAYADSQWVKGVSRMRRRFPNRVEMEFLLRMPEAQVRYDNRYWMVDGDACLLPVAGSPERFPSLPVIAGVTANVVRKPPQPGGKWNDEGVLGALGIMRAFWGSPLAEVVSIDRVVVTTGSFRDADGVDKESRRRFEVVDASGAVVRWGTFNAGELAGELTSAEKLWSLQDLLARDEALRPGVCFDVRTKLPGYSLLGDPVQ